jgi:uncharacterized membrane protein
MYLTENISHLKMSDSFEKLYYLNVFTATVHLISGSYISFRASTLEPIPASASKNSTGPYLPAVCFDPPEGRGRPRFYIEPEPVAEYREYITTLVVMFFMLSAFFQYAQCLSKKAYRNRIESNGVNELRYVEYCISASVMMILIACVVGIFDVFTHILIFTLSFLCMILGLIADFVRKLTETMNEVRESLVDTTSENSSSPTDVFANVSITGSSSEATVQLLNRTSGLDDCIKHGGFIMWGLHFLGWVAILVPYFAVFFVAYFTSVNKNWECLDKNDPDLPDVPQWVTYIIFGQFFLFSVFGVVQTVQFYQSRNVKTNKKSVGIGTELAFILLSLLSKSILGWIAAAQIIFA